MGISHIKNMYTERLKYEIEVQHDQPLIEETNRIYKPTYTIEFNREGEVLLYSCEPTKEVIFLSLDDCLFQISIYFIRIYDSSFCLSVSTKSYEY